MCIKGINFYKKNYVLFEKIVIFAQIDGLCVEK